MPDSANDREYKGSAARLLASMLLYLVLIAIVASYGLMGGHWAALFLFSLAAVLPIALAVAALSSWANRFSFDDDAKRIVKPGRTAVPYEKVTGIFINKRGSVIDAFIRRKWKGTSFLVEALPATEQLRLEEGLAARFPGLPVRTKRWGTLAAALTLLLLLLTGFGAAHAYLYHRTPQLALHPQALAWDRDEAVRKKPPQEYLEDFAFILPAGVKLISDQDNQLYFEDKVKKLRVKVVANIQRPELETLGMFFRYAMGVRDYYELLDLSYQARVGIVPVFLRSLELQGLENITVHRVGPPFLRGYITQGKRDDEEETHIVLVGDRPREEIHFFVTGPSRAPEKFIRTIVSGARLISSPRI
jgi:hypothetical protein